MSEEMRRAMREAEEAIKRQVTGYPKLRGAAQEGAGVIPSFPIGAIVNANAPTVAKYDLSTYNDGDDYG